VGAGDGASGSEAVDDVEEDWHPMIEVGGTPIIPLHPELAPEHAEDAATATTAAAAAAEAATAAAEAAAEPPPPKAQVVISAKAGRRQRTGRSSGRREKEVELEDDRSGELDPSMLQSLMNAGTPLPPLRPSLSATSQTAEMRVRWLV
jgi:hypothetical protein